MQLMNWIAEKKMLKKIKFCQKRIDGLNNGLASVAHYEQYYLEEAATELENARKYEDYLDFKSTHLEWKKIAEESAKIFTDMRPPALKRLLSLESLKKREIEALQHRRDVTTQKTRHCCLFF
ncbi:PREDICTED: uncharacterized protein LOC104712498 [Camelina sativa]|uniref:Uncharacterized protein LOC104712498 n=1 Tax=Camelina sativa TaxID=90675 RepID=A0ABM0TKG2_CAMSA|nr:PREDICTED: uncharacterized protein LOC104712498 [Camelina sativa]XP_019085781.1 PREDICTED: uncharacterized protein LOC104712498 [Camelina sativa]